MNKEKLIRDLCARLPYDVKVLYDNKVFSIDYVSSKYEEIKLNIINYVFIFKRKATKSC